MSTVSGKVVIDISFREVKRELAGVLGSKSGPIEMAFKQVADLANGTADGQINKAFWKLETGIGASTTTVYDLIGTLTDADGATINFDEVVGFLVVNLSTTAANYLYVGPDASNGFGVIAANKGFYADATDRDVVVADGESYVLKWCKTGVPAANASTDELAVITQSGTSANTWLFMAWGRDN